MNGMSIISIYRASPNPSDIWVRLWTPQWTWQTTFQIWFSVCEWRMVNGHRSYVDLQSESRNMNERKEKIVLTCEKNIFSSNSAPHKFFIFFFFLLSAVIDIRRSFLHLWCRYFAELNFEIKICIYACRSQLSLFLWSEIFQRQTRRWM